MVNALQPWHVIVFVVVVIVVFGSKKLPDAARSLGKSMRIFKSEMRELKHEGNSKIRRRLTPCSRSASTHRLPKRTTPTPGRPEARPVDPLAAQCGATDNHP